MADTPRTEDLEALVNQFQSSDLTELLVRTGEFQLFLSRDPTARAPWDRPAAAAAPAPARSAAAPAAAPVRAAAPAPAPAQATAAAPTAEQFEAPEGMDIVRAPYLGHFYRAPKPGAPHFVEIGDTVEPGADLCLVEVMKLFTAVRAETKGVVRHVYAVDGEMVQEGQPLFALQPVA